MAGKKKMTLIQFQAWLEGVEEMHPEDWCPTADQWKLIRNKIKTIIAPDPSTLINNNSASRTIPDASFPTFTPAPEVPSGIPNGPIVPPAPEAASLLEGNAEGKRTTPTSESGDASPFS